MKAQPVDLIANQEWIKYHLRPLEPRDNTAYNDLLALSPQKSLITIQSRFNVNPYEILVAGQDEQIVVVAETPDGSVVGTGMAAARLIWFRGQPVQAVRLFGIQVHPEYRQGGVATALTRWRTGWARQHFGSNVLIFAEIDQDDVASFRNAAHWANGFGQPRESGFARVLKDPPEIRGGVRINEATEADYGQIVEGLNAFNREVDFTRFVTIERLHRNHDPQHGTVTRHQYLVRVNNSIVGGATLIDPDPAIEMRIVRAPLLNKWFARASGMIHTNGTIRGGELNDIWYEPGYAEATHYLIETLRYRAAATAHALIIKVTNPKVWQALKIAHWQPYSVQSVAYYCPKFVKYYRLLKKRDVIGEGETAD